MALNIISARQTILVTSVIAYLYADPGIGKTSLAFTASRPLLFDFDQGAHRAGKMRRGGTVTVTEWSDVSSITAEDLVDVDTLIIDTAGRMLECIKANLAKNANNRQGDGSLKLKAHGAAGEIFRTWLTLIKSFGKDIVLIAHAAEAPKGDNIIIRPDIGGKNQGELYKQADLMGYMTNIEGKGNNTERVIDFVPNVAYLAKNSGNLGLVKVPRLEDTPTFLGDLLQQSKDFINSMTDAQVKEMSDIDDLTNWGHDCELCENAEDLNAMIRRLDKEHSRYIPMKKAMMAKSSKLDVTLDKQLGVFNDNAFVPPAETLAEQVALSPEADELLTFIINATLEADLIRAEQQIADLAKSERQPLLNAVYNRRVELEGNTQDYIAPSVQPETLIDDSIPNVIITEETLAQDIEFADSASSIDHVIRQIENHDNQVERTRLLKTASAKRRTLKANEQEHAA